MNLEDSVAEIVAELAAGHAQARNAVEHGLGLAVATWTEHAVAGGGRRWDTFGLDVCAAAEALHLLVVPTGSVHTTGGSEVSARRAMARLVDAMADRLEAEAAEDGQALTQQLELHAAAAQLRQGREALT
jgi:hypothetical protein